MYVDRVEAPRGAVGSGASFDEILAPLDLVPYWFSALTLDNVRSIVLVEHRNTVAVSAMPFRGA